MDERDDDLSALIKAKATRHVAPSQLRARIDARIAELGSARAGEIDGTAASIPPMLAWRRWTNMGAAFVVGVVASFVVTLALRGAGEEDRLAQAVLDSHVRSLMGAHLVDVESTDKHTVKPWFSGKLDYAPPVKDLASEGIPLAGGRLDYLGQRPVAALVYRLNQHTINVFVWPATGDSPRDPVFAVRQGFNVAHWSADGMQFWAVSDVNAGELRNVVRLLALRDKP
ncbi:MAG TPA: anti-sigma factor [Burkholderiales bacterium]|nr:anti-sigma factor [Burkholderiales bacterium]